MDSVTKKKTRDDIIKHYALSRNISDIKFNKHQNKCGGHEEDPFGIMEGNLNEDEQWQQIEKIHKLKEGKYRDR